MREPDDDAYLLVRGNFHFEIPVHIIHGEPFQLRATFWCEVFSGMMGGFTVNVEMGRKGFLFHYAIIPFLIR